MNEGSFSFHLFSFHSFLICPMHYLHSVSFSFILSVCVCVCVCSMLCAAFGISTEIMFYYSFHIAIVCSIHLTSNSLNSILFIIIAVIQRHLTEAHFLQCSHSFCLPASVYALFCLLFRHLSAEVFSIEQSTTLFQRNNTILMQLHWIQCQRFTNIPLDDKSASKHSLSYAHRNRLRTKNKQKMVGCSSHFL